METNLETYGSEDVVSYYQKYVVLQKPEEAILSLLAPQLKSMTMLDIGIGAGRTTAYFAPLVKKYVGVDYSPGMVEASRKKFEGHFENGTFLQADVRNLECFEEGSFDFVLFSFNGIDYINEAEREMALQQIRRVLKKNGFFCFSSHNLVSLLDLRAFEFRLNLIAAVKRFFEVKKIRKLNARQLALAPQADHLVINDGAHDFSLETFYVRPSYQVKQLEQNGFGNIQMFAHTTGNVLTTEEGKDSGKEKWIYYLCHKD